MIHDFEGHGVDVAGDDRSGEDTMVDQLNELYAQHGIEMVSDDVSGAWLDPVLVREGRDVGMKFFKDMGVYECVPRTEHKETGGNIIGTKL